MNTKYLVVDYNGKREVVKQIGKVFPNIRRAVLLKTLIIKPVYLRDLTILSEKCSISLKGRTEEMKNTEIRDFLSKYEFVRDILPKPLPFEEIKGINMKIPSRP